MESLYVTSTPRYHSICPKHHCPIFVVYVLIIVHGHLFVGHVFQPSGKHVYIRSLS